MRLVANIRNAASALFRDGGTLTQKVMRGGVWVAISFGAEKVLGIVRSVILARLLIPEDFGLMGVTAVALAGLSIFTSTGIESAIIQRKDSNERILNTAWLISIIRGFLLCVLLLIAAPYVALFFNDSRLILIVRAMSVIFLSSGFKNIGLILLQKELDFRRKTYLGFTVSVCTTTTAIVLAFFLKSVWALVLAEIVGSFVGLLASYLIHPFRPTLGFESSYARELLGFGKFIFVQGIIIYLITQGDDAVVGKMLGMTSLGFYTLAYAVANMFTKGITEIISQVSFPAYSKIQDERDPLAAGYLKVLAVTSFLVFPMAGLLFAFAPEFVEMVYGQKWLPIVLPMQVLCFLGIFRATASTIGPVFVGTGRPEIPMKIKLWELILMVAIIYPLAKYWGIIGVALAGTLTYLLSLGLHLYFLEKILPRIKRDVFRTLRSPFISTLFMALVIMGGKCFLFTQRSPGGVLLTFFSGGAAYLVSYCGLERKRLLQLKEAMYVDWQRGQ